MATFRQKVEAAIPALRRYARALTRDADIADDLVQDTLVRALRSEHLFQGDEIRSWLYTILTNLNRNRLRSLARRPALVEVDLDVLDGQRNARRAAVDHAADRRPVAFAEAGETEQMAEGVERHGSSVPRACAAVKLHRRVVPGRGH